MEMLDFLLRLFKKYKLGECKKIFTSKKTSCQTACIDILYPIYYYENERGTKIWK